MDRSEHGSGKLSGMQIVTAVIVPLLVVLLPLIFGDTPLSRMLWGKTLAPTATALPAVVAPPANATPSPANTLASPGLGSSGTANPCLWSAYLDSAGTTPLSNDLCLNGLPAYGISSNNEKELTFLLNGSTKAGVYGVCREVSGESEIKFHLDLKNNLTLGRFLIALASEPNPIKNSHALRLQFDSNVFDIKTIEFNDSGFDNGVSFIPANPVWEKAGNLWGLDFQMSLTPVQFKGSVNGVNVISTPLNSSPKRYLCFAYQASPGAQATLLNVKVTFQ